MKRTSINKVLLIALVSCVIATTLCAQSERGSGKDKPSLLKDSFVLAGVNGKLIWQAEKWYFQLYSDLSDGRSTVKAGRSIELLASSTLAKMIPETKKAKPVSYKLWGRIVKYQGLNFIFPAYFLPLREVETNTHAPQGQKTPAKLVDPEPKDSITIPKDVMQMLKPQRVVNLAQLEQALASGKDSILVGRSGFIAKQSDGDLSIFRINAMGRNIENLSFELLPCQVLEKIEQEQASYPDKLHYKIAAILTTYQGRHYLLLQRATRIYSYGNFQK